MIYYCPLEHIETRYTEDMDVLLQREMVTQGKRYTLIQPEKNVQVIKTKKTS